MRKPLTGLLGGVALLLLPSISRADEVDDMISPVSDPTVFEDPRQSTELRPIYMHHKIQDDFVTQGGDANLYQLQLRAKLTDDLSFIATKAGFADLNPKAGLNDDEGFTNTTVGAKYTLHRDEDSILTGGLRYELPTGKEAVLQGTGDGNLNPFLTAGYTACGLNMLASTGMRLRMTGEDSSFWDTHLHVDYKIGDFYPLAEIGMIKVMNDGNRIPLRDEGADFFNLGSSMAAGRTMLNASVGARYRITNDIDAGVAYQFPLDRGVGNRLTDWRLTADMIFRFNFS
jgi:hypothetical protein